jgi:hypothetical protein
MPKMPEKYKSSSNSSFPFSLNIVPLIRFMVEKEKKENLRKSTTRQRVSGKRHKKDNFFE